MVGRPVSVARPPWFDTMMPSAPLLTASAASSALSSPLMTTFIFGNVLHALHEIPRQRGGRERHVLHVEAGEHRLDADRASVASRAGDAVTAGAHARIDSRQALVRLGIPAGRQIDGHRHHRTSRRLGTLQQPRRDVPVVRRVELVPQAAAASTPGDLLDRRRRLRRQNLQLPARPGGACHGQLAFGMEGPLTANGTQQHGRGEPLPEDVHSYVDAADVDEPASAQLIPIEAARIRPERLLAVDAGGQVAPVRWGQHGARHGLEVVHIQRVRGAGQGRGGRLRSRRLGERLQQGRRSEQQRAAGEKFQELATIGHCASSWI